MNGLLLLAALAIGYWAWRTREGQALRIGDIAAVVAALVGARLLSRGAALPALAAFAGVGWWAWFRKDGQRKGTAMTRAAARRLLEVPPDASAEAIRAAHRRLVARVHPDVGGSAELTQQVNAARDVLLRGHR